MSAWRLTESVHPAGMSLDACIILYFCVRLQLHLFTFPLHVEFVDEPDSINITKGLTATFNCTGHSIGSYWLVNELLPSHYSNSHRGLTTADRTINSATNLKEHLINVPATQANDGVKIQCFIFNQPAIASDIAVLMIQG